MELFGEDACVLFGPVVLAPVVFTDVVACGPCEPDWPPLLASTGTDASASAAARLSGTIRFRMDPILQLAEGAIGVPPGPRGMSLGGKAFAQSNNETASSSVQNRDSGAGFGDAACETAFGAASCVDRIPQHSLELAVQFAPRPLLFLSSSMAEHPAVNRRVAGSSPA